MDIVGWNERVANYVSRSIAYEGGAISAVCAVGRDTEPLGDGMRFCVAMVFTDPMVFIETHGDSS